MSIVHKLGGLVCLLAGVYLAYLYWAVAAAGLRVEGPVIAAIPHSVTLISLGALGLVGDRYGYLPYKASYWCLILLSPLSYILLVAVYLAEQSQYGTGPILYSSVLFLLYFAILAYLGDLIDARRAQLKGGKHILTRWNVGDAKDSIEVYAIFKSCKETRTRAWGEILSFLENEKHIQKEGFRSFESFYGFTYDPISFQQKYLAMEGNRITEKEKQIPFGLSFDELRRVMELQSGTAMWGTIVYKRVK